MKVVAADAETLILRQRRWRASASLVAAIPLTYGFILLGGRDEPIEPVAVAVILLILLAAAVFFWRSDTLAFDRRDGSVTILHRALWRAGARRLSLVEIGDAVARERVIHGGRGGPVRHPVLSLEGAGGGTLAEIFCDRTAEAKAAADVIARWLAAAPLDSEGRSA